MRLVAFLLCAALWLGSAAAWPALPDPVPSRVSGGEIVAWADKSASSWFLLPALATALLLLVIVVTRLASRRPALLNIPGKEQLLALPPARQAPVLAEAAGLIDGSSALMMAVFGAAQYARWHVANGGSSDTVLLLVLPLAVLSTPLVLGLWLPRITNELERQVKAHRAEGGTVPSG